MKLAEIRKWSDQQNTDGEQDGSVFLDGDDVNLVSIDEMC